MHSSYVKWLMKQGVPLFKGGGIYWKMKKGALIPASLVPSFIKLTQGEARAILKESGAWFIRYSSEHCEGETDWWYITCDRFDPGKFSSNTRSKINRGNRRCSVKRIDVEWLASHGYKCCVAAYSRYKNATPVSEERFRDNILSTAGGPFDFWGVFVKDNLVGFCQCIVEDNEVITHVIKYDPAFLKHYSSYVLMNAMLKYYIDDRAMVMFNGYRSIAHDTNIQDFLLKFGYRKQFCRLVIVYQSWLELVVHSLYPFRKLISYLPNHSSIHKVQSLLSQEELRKKCDVATI